MPDISTTPVARNSPMAPPRSFLWSRRIFLTVLTGFVLLLLFLLAVTGVYLALTSRGRRPADA